MNKHILGIILILLPINLIFAILNEERLDMPIFEGMVWFYLVEIILVMPAALGAWLIWGAK